MTSLYAYPRLEYGVARELLAYYSGRPLTELRSRSAVEHSRADWYPTAGARVDESTLHRLRDAVRAVAGENGWPEKQGSAVYTRFDQQLCTVLLRTMHIVPADAADEGVWSFLALVLLPDVALWRFPNERGRPDYERILGRPRNVFRRLWWRAYVLGGEVDGPAAHLLEDEAVAIMERPSLSGTPEVARTIATVHLDLIRQRADLSRTELMREATKRLRRMTTFLTLQAMDERELKKLVTEVFLETAAALVQRR